MKIEFETGDLTEAEATGLIALMAAIHGEGIIPTSYARVGEVERATGPVTLHIHRDSAAPDGYPSTGSIEVKQVVDVSDKFDPDHPAYTPPAPTTAGDRDADGILWDERIHTSNKSTKQDGTWKRKPGLDDAYFTSVMAELKAANTARTLEAAQGLTAPVSGPVNDIAPNAPPLVPTAREAFTPPASVTIPAYVPPAPVADPSSQTVVAVPVTVPQPPAPPVPAVPTPPPVPTGDAPTFPQLIQRITPLQAAGKIDAAKLAELLEAVGLKSIAELVSASAEARTNLSALLDTVQ
jgi:hypothetical protein